MRKVEINRVALAWGDGSNPGGLTVILKELNGNRSLPIFIGVPEGQALLLGLRGLRPQRPMTHDLLSAVVRQMGGVVKGLIVSALEGSVFRATLRIGIGEKTVEVDCRPSDGIALAARSSSPLYVEEPVLDAAGLTDLSKFAPFFGALAGHRVKERHARLEEKPGTGPTSLSRPALRPTTARELS